jgi:hypothetical protein
LAAKFGHEGCLRVIAGLGVVPEQASDSAAAHGVRMRGAGGLAVLGMPNYRGLTPAHLAALHGHAGCLALLAGLRVDLSPGNKDGAQLALPALPAGIADIAPEAWARVVRLGLGRIVALHHRSSTSHPLGRLCC